MIFSQRKYLAQGILFIFLSLVTLIPEGALLCISEKGHRMIEVIELGFNSVDHSPVRHSSEHHVSKDDHGPCFDIPSPDNIITNDTRQYSSTLQPAVLFLTASFILPSISMSRFQPFNIVRHELSLKSLQSTILRI